MTTERLRIAMLSVHSCPVGKLGEKDTGGMSVYIRELAGELGKLGHVVDIYTRAHDSEHQQIMKLGENVRLIHLKAGEDEKIHKLAVYLHLPDFACNLENFRRRNHLRYDLVFSHYWLSAWVGKLLQGWWNVPHMTAFHTLGAVKNAIGIGEDEPELRIETERYVAKSCHRIIAATEKEKEDIVLHYGVSPEMIRVIPCGVNLSMFRPMDKEMAKQKLGFNGGKTILFVGRIEPLKGIGRLLTAMTYLGKEQRVKLVIIGGDGNGEYLERLHGKVRELQIEGLVSFMGMVRQEELPGYYNAADISVIPSYYESFGLVTLESLACGTPVVATAVGGAGSVIRQGETGYVVKSGSPRHLAQRMEQLLFKSKPGAESVNSIRASVAGFDWSKVAEAMVKEYSEMAENHSTRRR
ncbi:glycosyltransferase [Chloroflexota bacterium]